MKRVLIILIVLATLIFTACAPVSLEQDNQSMDEDEQIVLAQDIPAQPTTNQDIDEISNQPETERRTLDDLIIPDGMEWDENYPLNVLALFPDGKIELVDVSQLNSSSIVKYRSEFSLYDVTVHFFDILVAADDFKMIDKDDHAKLFGTTGGYYFEVTCDKEVVVEAEGEEILYYTLITVAYKAVN